MTYLLDKLNKYITVTEANPYKRPAWAHASDFPKIYQKSTNPKQAITSSQNPNKEHLVSVWLYLLPSGPKSSTSGSQPRFTS